MLTTKPEAIFKSSDNCLPVHAGQVGRFITSQPVKDQSLLLSTVSAGPILPFIIHHLKTIAV
jgi:hypothetical protein